MVIRPSSYKWNEHLSPFLSASRTPFPPSPRMSLTRKRDSRGNCADSADTDRQQDEKRFQKLNDIIIAFLNFFGHLWSTSVGDILPKSTVNVSLMYNLGIPMYPQPLILLGHLGTLERGTAVFCMFSQFLTHEALPKAKKSRSNFGLFIHSLNAAEAEQARPTECDPALAGQRVVFHTRILPHTFLGIALLAVDSFLTLSPQPHCSSGQSSLASYLT